MKKITLQAVFCLLIIFINDSLYCQTKTIPYQQLTSGSGIYFGATMNSSSITVSFEGPADRWFAFGIGTFMYPADAFIYSNGVSTATHTIGWYDYNNTVSATQEDGTQDWNIVSTGSVSGQRTVTATRALNTGDANDAVITFSATTLSLIWAKGASANDYTISYHGSSNRACCISLTWLSQPTASFATSTTSICAGSSLTYSNLTSGGQTSYTWSFAGGNPSTSNSTSPNVQYTTPGTYSVALTATNAIGSSTYTQVNYITVTPTVAPSLSIALTGGSNPLCAGSLITFTASSTNGGGSPSYQWKVNGANAGTNSSTFTTTSLSNGAVVTCVMTSNATCATPSAITSSGITMTVNSTAAASVSIALTSNNNPICTGATATFTATPGNGGTTPSYQWKINSTNVGNNSSTFTTNTLSNGDIVTCVLSSNASCASSTLATSAGITMTVSSILTPTIGISISGGTNPLCAGSSITFSASQANGGSSPSYQWKVNGVNTGTNGPVFGSSTLTNGNTISCVMISNLSCSSPNTATSSAVTLTVYSIPPAPAISPSGSAVDCYSSYTLITNASSGVLWSNGATSNTIIVTGTGTFAVTQTSNGCTSLASATTSVTLFGMAHATLNPIGPLCVNDAPQQLQGLPVFSSGSYSGQAVSGSMFSPSLANIGSNNIVYYTYVRQYNIGIADFVCVDSAAIRITVDNCSGINELNNANSIVSVYPNPSSGKFLIQCDKEKIVYLKLFDIQGKQFFKEDKLNEHEIELELNDYPPGFYLLEIRLETTIVRSKLIKQK